MKRLISAVFLISTAVLLFGEDFELQKTFKRHLSDIEAFSDNSEGSEKEKQLVSWMTDLMQSLETDYAVTDFSDARELHSFSVNLQVDIPGEEDETLIIAVPINGNPRGSGAVGIAAATTMIQYYAHRVPPLTMRFLFLGAEFGPDDSYPLGSRYYLQEFYPDRPVVVLYLDIASIPSGLELHAGGDGITSPLWLLDTCSESIRRSGMPCSFSVTDMLISRLGINDTPSIITPYLEAGYPALLLRESGVSSEGDPWIKSLHGLLESLLSTCDKGIPTYWDKHYLFFRFPEFDLSLGETDYVAGLIVLLCGVLLYPLVFTRRFFRYMKTLGKNVLLLPLMLPAVFLFLLMGTFLAQIIPSVKHFPDLWMHAPFLFFLLKSTGAILLFIVLFRFVRHMPFPRRSSFYSAAAILFLLIDILILSVIELSLALYVTWAFFFCFLFTIFRNRYLKILMFLLSLILLCLVMYDIFTLPALRVCEVLLYSHVKGNLLTAFILLPFLFMLIRIDLLFPHRTSKRRNIIIRSFFDLLLGAFVYLSITLILLDPYGDELPQPLYISESVEGDDHTAEVSSPRYIAGLERRSMSLTLPPVQSTRFFDTDLTVETFLDRMNISLLIRSKVQPETINIVLRSDQRLVVYDSTFPYSIDPVSGSARFFIGRNPPENLEFQLTLPSVLEGHFEIETLYQPPSTCIKTPEQVLFLDRTVEVKQTIPLLIDTSESME